MTEQNKTISSHEDNKGSKILIAKFFNQWDKKKSKYVREHTDAPTLQRAAFR